MDSTMNEAHNARVMAGSAWAKECETVCDTITK
jgi:hypothetical protein